MIYSVVKKNLINGRMMVCPRCKKDHDILQYIRLEMIEEYAHETTPVYKCCSCKWLFSPSGEMPQEIYEKFYRMLEEIANKS